MVPAPQRNVATTALIAAGWASGIGFVVATMVTVVTWAVSGHDSAGFESALRAGGLVFAAAHHVPVSIGGTEISLLPFGFLLVPLLLLRWVGRWAAVTVGPSSRQASVTLVVGIGLWYALLASVVVTVCATTSASASGGRTAVTAFAVAVAGAGLGTAGHRRPRSADLPAALHAVGRSAGLMVSAMYVLATALVALWSIGSRTAISEVFSASASSTGDRVLLGLLLLGYLPTLTVWAMAYATGVGVTIGNVLVTPVAAATGALPAVPLLTVLPVDPPSYAGLLPWATVVVGVVGGAHVARSAGSTREAVVRAAASVGATSVAVFVLGLLASGGLGTGLLSRVGPSPIAMLWHTAGLLVIGALPTAALVAWGLPRAVATGSRRVGAVTGGLLRPSVLRPRLGRLAGRVRFSLYDDGTSG